MIRSRFTETQIVKFLKEAEAGVAVLAGTDFGEADGLPYIVMRYMPFGSVRERLDKASGSGLPLPEIVKTIQQIADALDFAHKKM